MEFTNESYKETNREWNAIVDFILSRVDDPDCHEVQKRLNEMREKFFECFNY